MFICILFFLIGFIIGLNSTKPSNQKNELKSYNPYLLSATRPMKNRTPPEGGSGVALSNKHKCNNCSYAIPSYSNPPPPPPRWINE